MRKPKAGKAEPSIAETLEAAKAVADTAIVPSGTDQSTAALFRPKSAAGIRAALKAKGIKSDLKGGSLPMLPFPEPGHGYLVRWVGGPVPAKGAKFKLLTFEVLDTEKYEANPLDPDEAVLGRAQMTEGASTSWFASEESKHEAGDGAIFLITYGGTMATKNSMSRGGTFNDMKAYTIEEIPRTKVVK